MNPSSTQESPRSKITDAEALPPQQQQQQQQQQQYPSIQPMPAESVRRIVAGQAVFDLASCTKELLDNALDAGSKSINIRLFNKGLNIVEVSDDGCGVPKPSRPSLATPHATSKINTFDDIYNDNCTTLGFRGEALYCLANLSTKLVVATRCASDALAQKMEFARDGSLIPETVSEMPRKIGTTVAVIGLLSALPVRRRDMEQRITQHRSRLVHMVTGYAVFSTGVRIYLMDLTNNKETSILATAAHSQTLKDTVSSVLGPKYLATLSEIEVDLSQAALGGNGETHRDDDEDHDAATEQAPPFKWKMTGLISTAGVAPEKAGKKSHQQQYFAINRRPVDLPKVARLLKECFRSFGQDRTPACVLEFKLPGAAYDINLSPDKRQVLLTHETAVLEAIEKAVVDLWSSQTDGQFQPSESLSNLAPPLREAAADDNATVEEEDLMGNSSGGSSRLFDRRYAFVHDPTTSVAREQDDEQRRLEYVGSSPDRSLLRKRKSDRPAAPPPLPNESAAEGQEDATALRKTNRGTEEEDADEVAQSSSPSNRRIPKRLRTQDGGDGHNNEDVQAGSRTTDSITITTTSSNDCEEVTVTPSPAGHPFPNQLSIAVGVSAAPARENQSNRNAKDGNEHDKMPAKFSTHIIHNSVNHIYQSTSTRSGPAPLDEQKQWRDVQARFNKPSESEEEEEEKEEHDKRPESIAAKATGFERFRAASSKTTSRETTTTSNSKTPKAYELERFGFRAVSKDAGEKGISSAKGATTTTKSTKPQFADRKTSSGATREQARAVSDGSDESKDRLAATAASAAAASKVPAACEATPSTVWTSFSGTNEVVMASMRNRIAQRDRKRKHRSLFSSSSSSSSSTTCGSSPDPENGSDLVGDPAAAESLNERTKTVSLTKDDFKNMTVIGQFNMGFIVARSQNGNLWILDQHASDEKYNFEKLCSETVIHEQRLIAPMPLELSPAEEACVLDHMDIFQKNGFRFKYDEDKPPRHRLSLTALPHSGARDGRNAVQYGKDDVSALCAILGADDEDEASAAVSGGTGTDGSGMYGNNAVRRYHSTSAMANRTSETIDRIIARLPKSIAMFASRACRGSIMIGTALSEKEMDKIVKRLAEIEHPWNCPHGRPTMRHVGDLRPMLLEDDRRHDEHVAGPTVTVMSQELEEED